jgi:glycosyltransferase involved in cell wall biosynthesis
MRILYITHFFPPELNGGAKRVEELTRIWAATGHRVTVTTGFPSHPSGIVPDRYKGKWWVEEHKDGVRVVRTKKYSTPNRGFFKRILNHLSLALSAFVVNLLKREEYDLVISTSPPLFTGFSGYLLSRMLGIPFIFEVRDLWPQQAIELGILKNRVLISLSEKLEVFFYKKASRIIAVTESSKKTITAKGIPESKIAVIRNGVDLEMLSRVPSRNVRDEKALTGKFVVSYIGTMGASQGLSVLIDAAEEFQRGGEDCIHFLLVGDGVERQNLIDLATQKGLRNVAFVEPQPSRDVLAFYAASDIVVVSLKNLDLFSKTIPSKIFEIMAVGKALVCMVNGECRSIVEESGGGVYVEPENVQALVKTIRELRHAGYDRLKDMGERGRQWVAKNANRKQQADNYAILLEKVIEEHHK